MHFASKWQSHTLNKGIVALSRISTECRRALFGLRPKGNACDKYQESQVNLHLLQHQVPSGDVSDEDKGVIKADSPRQVPPFTTPRPHVLVSKEDKASEGTTICSDPVMPFFGKFRVVCPT